MDGLCLKTGIHGVAPPISLNGSLELRSNLSHVNAVGKSSYDDKPPRKTSLSFSFSLRHPFKSLWNGDAVNSRYNGMALDDAVLIENKEDMEFISPEQEAEATDSDGRNGSWVLKIMDVMSLWSEVEKKSGDEQKEEAEEVNAAEKDDGNKCELEQNNDDEEEGCEICRAPYEEKEENDVEFDSSSFSRFLRRVPLADARLFARMSYLGNLAYSIPNIEPGNLLKNMGLKFITSSLEKREMDINAEKDLVSVESRGEESQSNGNERPEVEKNNGIQKSSSTAYDMAASAASYLHSHTESILPFKLSKANASEDSEMASLMATTESVTAVVAAKEEVKQAVADNLKSTCSSPCEWFICDDDQSGTRFFVIQGSESLASWQANLLFEPIQFEGQDVVVHRGIYEAAKGIYDQMLPEVHAHLKSRGSRATLRFTGHSLGGSLSLLINLMLLIRLEAPISTLLPVITFGSPSIMCGGDLLLRKLGLPRSHVQAVSMHRDIVPRVFSCKYPSHVAKLLMALNGNFRNHPCLNNQKLLYAPMGELLILQPDENFSPNHHLLPSGSGLYLLVCPEEKLLYAAQTGFLNSPHPLEILSDRAAYGHGGTVQRDHDMESYLKSIREVIRQELKQISVAKKERHRKVWQPVLSRSNRKSTIEVGNGAKFNFSGAVQIGRKSFKRFSTLVASQQMHLFVVLLFPAKLLLLGAFN